MEIVTAIMTGQGPQISLIHTARTLMTGTGRPTPTATTGRPCQGTTAGTTGPELTGTGAIRTSIIGMTEMTGTVTTTTISEARSMLAKECSERSMVAMQSLLVSFLVAAT